MIRFIRSHQNLIKMNNDKDFEKWRADTIGYVFFSRLNNLIIKETGKDNPYLDYVIDIGDNHRRQTSAANRTRFWGNNQSFSRGQSFDQNCSSTL